MRKSLFIIISVIGLSILFISWGATGHKKISLNCTLSFNQAMNQFLVWGDSLQIHSSDADDRKSTDPNEAPKHYIDIDNYSEFNMYHHITQNYDSLVMLHGQSYVIQQGILPYATKTTFDTLVACFQRLDWRKAMLTTSDLGHYVGDGHMPLHITNNYDGGLTNQNGIHSRYESTMIDDHVNDIIYTGDTISFITNVSQYIFNYIYINHTYADSVLQADVYAKELAGNTYSTAYTNALWDKSKGFTTMLFKNASHALAELLYTAWVTAGSPSMIPQSVQQLNNPSKIKLQCTPNPFINSVKIEYTLFNNNDNISIDVKDIKGNNVETLFTGKKLAGTYQLIWQPKGIKEGVYFITLKTDNTSVSQKVLYNK